MVSQIPVPTVHTLRLFVLGVVLFPSREASLPVLPQGVEKMVLRFAHSCFCAVKCHIQANDRYRFFPLYSVALGALIHLAWHWPWEIDNIGTWFRFPWLVDLEVASLRSAGALSVCFAVVGLFRPTIMAKVLSVTGIYMTNQVYYLFGFVDRLVGTIIWYTIDVPEQFFVRIAGEGTGGERVLWCVYLLCIYMLIRPLLVTARRYLEITEQFIVDKWPLTARFAKPVL